MSFGLGKSFGRWCKKTMLDSGDLCLRADSDSNSYALEAGYLNPNSGSVTYEDSQAVFDVEFVIPDYLDKVWFWNERWNEVKDNLPDPKYYYHHQGQPWVRSNRFGYTEIKVLPELIGRKFDKVALGFINGLRPSMVRVTTDYVTSDAVCWRVTVRVDKDDNIVDIHQEVEVATPEGIVAGHGMNMALKQKTES